jgi:hypothetical protein
MKLLRSDGKGKGGLEIISTIAISVRGLAIILSHQYDDDLQKLNSSLKKKKKKKTE